MDGFLSLIFIYRVFLLIPTPCKLLKQGFQARCARGRSKALSYRLTRVENVLLGASRLAKTFSTLAQKVLKSDFGINIVFVDSKSFTRVS
jgi:hypothetical protein